MHLIIIGVIIQTIIPAILAVCGSAQMQKQKYRQSAARKGASSFLVQVIYNQFLAECKPLPEIYTGFIGQLLITGVINLTFCVFRAPRCYYLHNYQIQHYLSDVLSN